MEEKRSDAFEKMIKAILSQYDSTVEKIAKLKTEGKEKFITFNYVEISSFISYLFFSVYNTNIVNVNFTRYLMNYK